jgi:hypothetical protein
MTVIGNILLFLASLIFIALSSVLYKTPPGGDAAVSYIWTIILLNLGFFICMIFITVITGTNGGYDWVSAQKSTRFLLTASGLLVSLITMVMSSVFRHENGPVPSLLRLLSIFAPLLIPAVLIITSFILLNKGIRMSVATFVYVWPLTVVAVLGVVGVATGLYTWAAEAARNQQAKIKRIMEDQDNNHARMLAEIDSCDVTKNMVFILVFTDANQDMDVREKAVAKIKTNPLWQEELIKRLKSDWAPEAFNFLASNDVDSKNLFPEPVNEGILIQAKLIRENIRASSHSSNFYPEQFSWETERVLRTANRFKGGTVNFLPAIKELRAALDEPSEFKKPAFICIHTLDKWIAEAGH